LLSNVDADWSVVAVLGVTRMGRLRFLPLATIANPAAHQPGLRPVGNEFAPVSP